MPVAKTSSFALGSCNKFGNAIYAPAQSGFLTSHTRSFLWPEPHLLDIYYIVNKNLLLYFQSYQDELKLDLVKSINLITIKINDLTLQYSPDSSKHYQNTKLGTTDKPTGRVCH